MNNIEKLAIEHLKQSGWGVKPFYQGNLEQLESFAQALQSSEPVAWIVPDFGFLFPTKESAERYLKNINSDAKPTPLYTISPSTVSLEEHNKALERIAELENGEDSIEIEKLRSELIKLAAEMAMKQNMPDVEYVEYSVNIPKKSWRSINKMCHKGVQQCNEWAYAVRKIADAISANQGSDKDDL